MFNVWLKYNDCYKYITKSGVTFLICPDKILLGTNKYEEFYTVYMDIAEMSKFDSLEEAKQFCLELEPTSILSNVEVTLNKVDKANKTIIFHYYQKSYKDL